MHYLLYSYFVVLDHVKVDLVCLSVTSDVSDTIAVVVVVVCVGPMKFSTAASSIANMIQPLLV